MTWRLNYCVTINWQLIELPEREKIKEAMFKGWIVLLSSAAVFGFSFLILSYSSFLFLFIPLILYGWSKKGEVG